jgi:diguanylate cyclase (GGDEF)-like protein/PAS domain S-box-containing protein
LGRTVLKLVHGEAPHTDVDLAPRCKDALPTPSSPLQVEPHANGHDPHLHAREQTIGWMADAIRQGDYLDALAWLNTLAAADASFTLASESTVAAWRSRAHATRAGRTVSDGPGGLEPATDPNGLCGALLEHPYLGVVISCLEDGWILAASESFAELSGYTRAELIGRTSIELELIDPHIRRALVNRARGVAQTGVFRTELRRKDGAMRSIEFSPQLLAGNELMLTTVRDITEGETHIQHLRRLADNDALTQLLGRRRFREEVERHIHESSRFGDSATLLLVDLDDFKSINDTHGHLIGDQALVAVADALRGAVRESDAIGRLGGDEFGVLLLRTTDGGHHRVLHKIEQALAACTIETTGAPITFAASIGVAVLDDACDGYERLLRAADDAMYLQKTRVDRAAPPAFTTQLLRPQ